MASERCDCLCSNCACPTADGAGGLLEYPTGTFEGSAGQKKCLSENTPAAAVQYIFIKSKS